MSASTNVYLVAPVRTPIGKLNGQLATYSAVELGAIAAKEAITRAGLSSSKIDLTVFGNARQAGNGPNIARQVSVQAGIPVEKPAYTVNMACASGMQAILSAYSEVSLGHAQIVLAGGTESMSNVPYLLPKMRHGYRLGHAEIFDGNFRDGFMCPLCHKLMGETAETLATQYQISRAEQDAYAVLSQTRCELAIQNGRFKEEIVPVGDVIQDEHPRAGATLESLSKLTPVFNKNGTVHAGNASGVTDGAAALLVVSESQLKELQLKPMGRIAGLSRVGVDPALMGLGPVPSVRQLLKERQLSLSEIPLIELNEAFAVQVLACQKELGISLERLNVNGGAIALGHPIGCSGSRIVVTLLYEMQRRNVSRGLATLCVSGGLGVSLLIESGEADSQPD